MDKIAKAFELGMKGLNLITTLSQQGKDITKVVQATTNIFSKRPEDVTDADLDETEALLDAELDDFETPLKRQKTKK